MAFNFIQHTLKKVDNPVQPNQLFIVIFRSNVGRKLQFVATYEQKFLTKSKNCGSKLFESDLGTAFVTCARQKKNVGERETNQNRNCGV